MGINSKAAGSLDTSLALLRKLRMKSSARNILSGMVESVQVLIKASHIILGVQS